VITFEEEAVKISKSAYASAMFVPTSSRFNGFSQFSDDVISSYMLRMGDNTAHKARYSYLVSHLSNDSGVIAFETMLDSLGSELGVIQFVDTLTAPENIFAAVNADTLVFHYSDGRTGKLANPFRFPEPGTVK
jgi:hypothetical protein